MMPPGYGAHPNELEHMAKAATTNSFIGCPNAKSAEFVTERANAVNSVDQYSPPTTGQCASLEPRFNSETSTGCSNPDCPCE